MVKVIRILLLFILVWSSKQKITYLQITSDLSDNAEIVIQDGIVNSHFLDTIYKQKLCCKTQLHIVELSTDNNKILEFKYDGDLVKRDDIIISNQKQGTPLPSIYNITKTTIVLNTNCSQNPQDNNYWSKVDININQTTFSFRLHCDFGMKHRLFEWGYLIIMVLNSLIMIGVSLHSRIWSMTYKTDQELGVPVRWPWLLVAIILITGLAILVLWLDRKDDSRIFVTIIEIVGYICSFFFGMIVLNQLIFLIKPLRKQILGPIKICDIFSTVVSVSLVVVFSFLPSTSNNFIFNDILTIVISIGSIKLFKFSNLFDAIVCCFLVFFAQNLTSLIVYLVDNNKSYNDLFGAWMSSAIIMEIPTFTYLLYQKCSWLTMTQIILPGISIAYLRRYDFSRDSKLYFLIGNFLFVISTFLWILFQSITVYSLPFSLITYPILFIPIVLLAYQRDQLKNLIKGDFYQPQWKNSDQRQTMKKDLLNKQNRQSILRQSTLKGLVYDSGDLSSSNSSIK